MTMAMVRRPALVAEAMRRVGERKARIGGKIREARRRRYWTQQELAHRAGLGRLVISRLERGVGPLDIAGLERVCLALDLSLLVDVGRDLQEDVADAGHLAIQELVVRMARPAGFHPSVELATKPTEAWRSIDVALVHDSRRLLIAVECWNTISDFGAAARSSSRKLADLAVVAAARWSESSSVGIVWVVRATARNRGLIARYPEAFASRFPGSSRTWLDALKGSASPPSEPGLLWCDVGSSRLFAWRHQSVVVRSAPHGDDREE
jgi:transcriptional regulator with XRE-family HTH domain